jgi:hypothetical protein
MNTATMTFNEAINVLAAGYRNDMAAQFLAAHKQRDKSDAVLKARISTLEAENGSLKEKLAILEALVSQRAATAVSAMDDLSDSVIAEEAQAYAHAQEESEGEALVASVTGVTAVPKKARAASRDASKLSEILPEGTPLSLTSTGDRWDGSFTKDGFIFQEKLFKSPLAVTKAHADRITDRHPKATQPGSGWVFIKVEAGPYKGKSLGEAYDTFNKRVGMVGGGAMTE